MAWAVKLCSNKILQFLTGGLVGVQVNKESNWI